MTTTLLSPLEIITTQQHTQDTPAFALSTASAMTEQQLLVADVWREVTLQYIDTTYNGLGEEGWKQKRLQAVKAVTNVGPDDKEVVYTAIRKMLSALNDPYTRFSTPEQYSSLTAYARGDSAGMQALAISAFSALVRLLLSALCRVLQVELRLLVFWTVAVKMSRPTCDTESTGSLP